MTSTLVIILRKRLDLTQAEFAVVLGVSRAMVARLEAGANPSGPVAKLLAYIDMHGVL